MTGRCYGRMIAGGEGKSIPVAGHISRGVPVRTIPKLGAEAGRGIEAPVIQFLVCGLSWQIGIVLVRWIARPATFIRVELANEYVPRPARTVLSQDVKDTAARSQFVRADVLHINLI